MFIVISLAPEIETAPLFNEAHLYALDLFTSDSSKGNTSEILNHADEIIKNTIENGIAVRPYTVNKDVDMHRLFNINCTAFITDDPVKALKITKTI